MRPLESTSIVARRLASPHRVVEGQQQHARAEQDRRRRRGDEGQALEGVGDRQIRRELHLADPRARVERDVLGHVERLETQVVGVAGDRLQVCRVGAREAGVVTEAEFHTSKFSQTETRERTRARKVLRPVLPAVAQAEPAMLASATDQPQLNSGWPS